MRYMIVALLLPLLTGCEIVCVDRSILTPDTRVTDGGYRRSHPFAEPKQWLCATSPPSYDGWIKGTICAPECGQP